MYPKWYNPLDSEFSMDWHFVTNSDHLLSKLLFSAFHKAKVADLLILSNSSSVCIEHSYEQVKINILQQVSDI